MGFIMWLAGVAQNPQDEALATIGSLTVLFVVILSFIGWIMKRRLKKKIEAEVEHKGLNKVKELVLKISTDAPEVDVLKLQKTLQDAHQKWLKDWNNKKEKQEAKTKTTKSTPIKYRGDKTGGKVPK